MYKNKKLIFFSRDLHIGGMEKALVILLNALVNEGYSVTLTLQSVEGELLHLLDDRVKIKKFSLSTCKIVVIRKLLNLIHRFIWGLSNYHKYDFSCNYATYMTIGSRLAKLASSNSSLYVHSDYYNYFKGDTNTLTSFFKKQGIEEVKRLIFVSNEALLNVQAPLQKYKEKFCVISNLIDYSEIINLSCEDLQLSRPKDKELLLFVGRIEEESKKISRLLKAFKIVTDTDENYSLWIVGDGVDRKKSEELALKLDVCDNVEFLGATTNPYPFIKMADCVVMTSDFEGFPVIYNECLTLHTPIITTIPVSDKYVDFRNFAAIVDKNAQEIAKAILDKRYKQISYKNIDIDKINHLRLEEIKKIIEN